MLDISTNLGAVENLSQSAKLNEQALNTADLFSMRILFEAMFWKPKENKIKNNRNQFLLWALITLSTSFFQ